jgi:hypothetical protein
VLEKDPLAGSYSSALASTFESELSPPAIKTLPSWSRVADPPLRAEDIEPVSVRGHEKVPAGGHGKVSTLELI